MLVTFGNLLSFLTCHNFPKKKKKKKTLDLKFRKDIALVKLIWFPGIPEFRLVKWKEYNKELLYVLKFPRSQDMIRMRTT